MWPQWTYVTNNAIKKENKSKLTWFYVILHEQELGHLNDTVQQQLSSTVSLKRVREIKFHYTAGHSLQRFRYYLPYKK